MSYTRTNWVDGVTPLDASHMNNIEDGIEEAMAGATESTPHNLGVFNNPSTYWRAMFDAARTFYATVSNSDKLCCATQQGQRYLFWLSNIYVAFKAITITGVVYEGLAEYVSSRSMYILHMTSMYTEHSNSNVSTKEEAMEYLFYRYSAQLAYWASVSSGSQGVTFDFHEILLTCHYGDNCYLHVNCIDVDMEYARGWINTSKESLPGAADEGQPNSFVAHRYVDSGSHSWKFIWGMYIATGMHVPGGLSVLGRTMQDLQAAFGSIFLAQFDVKGKGVTLIPIDKQSPIYLAISNDSYYTCIISWDSTSNSWIRKPFGGPHVLGTGALVKMKYSELKDYKIIFCYGYRDAKNAPNQCMFMFMPDKLVIDSEDYVHLTQAGSDNWVYPIQVKRSNDGYVYWWSRYGCGTDNSNTTFYVTRILGV